MEFNKNYNVKTKSPCGHLQVASGMKTDQKGKEKDIFWGAVNVLYLDLGGSPMGIYTCKNSLSSTLQINAFYTLYCMYVISRK